MNINEYVKGKRYNDLSTDGYDWTKWCADNNVELERRIAAAGLQNCERNGRILLEYISENNLPVTIDALFGVLTDSRYNGRLVRLPPLPVARKPRPTLKSLGYARSSLLALSAADTKQLLRNEEIGTYAEVEAQYNEMVAGPAEAKPVNRTSAAEKLHQLGYQQDERPSHAQQAPSRPEQTSDQKLKIRQKEWDREASLIDALAVQGYMGKIDYARTQAAQRLAKEKLGPRP
jgi:hypothetical protein